MMHSIIITHLVRRKRRNIATKLWTLEQPESFNGIEHDAFFGSCRMSFSPQ
jgi:hypothetical protein